LACLSDEECKVDDVIMRDSSILIPPPLEYRPNSIPEHELSNSEMEDEKFLVTNVEEAKYDYQDQM
jgi:hypothetical protein